ncbi:MAG: GatB/YqeY domain-containing protein [Deltaproteobacteria bacterium]|nr:GatB/YqeY domain-containing protein [Deltaproteobacteria bacterium]
MLIDEIKKRLGEAIKAKNDVEREVLRVALGEIQTLVARNGRPATDDEAAQIVRKLVKSNEETRSVTVDDARRAVLEQEIAVLSSLLPKGPSAAEIVEKLAPVQGAIRAAGSDGQATGVAMKHLKAQGLSVPGSDVAAAVKSMRAA